MNNEFHFIWVIKTDPLPTQRAPIQEEELKKTCTVKKETVVSFFWEASNQRLAALAKAIRHSQSAAHINQI